MGAGVVQQILMCGSFDVNAMIPVLFCISWKVALGSIIEIIITLLIRKYFLKI